MEARQFDSPLTEALYRATVNVDPTDLDLVPGVLQLEIPEASEYGLPSGARVGIPAGHYLLWNPPNGKVRLTSYATESEAAAALAEDDEDGEDELDEDY